jgi:hypothetical protein
MPARGPIGEFAERLSKAVCTDDAFARRRRALRDRARSGAVGRGRAIASGSDLAPARLFEKAGPSMEAVSLIVMEPGSDWPGHVRNSENVVTIGHHQEGGLLQRTLQRVDSIQRRGQTVRVAVLACSVVTDAALLTSRTALAHELLRVVAAAPFGRLVLSVAERAPTDLRCELLSLAGALSHTLRATSVWVKFIQEADGRHDTALRKCARTSLSRWSSSRDPR